jgi:hypothetical protein
MSACAAKLTNFISATVNALITAYYQVTKPFAAENTVVARTECACPLFAILTVCIQQ